MYAVAVALVLIVAISSARVQQRSNCEATAFVLEDLERRPVVASPDDRWYVELGMKTQDHEEGWFLVRRGTTTVRSFKLEYLSAGVFVKWAADSTPFYLMWSNGGAIGEYSVRVFRITGGTVVEVPSSAQAERDFARRYPCTRARHVRDSVDERIEGASRSARPGRGLWPERRTPWWIPRPSR